MPTVNSTAISNQTGATYTDGYIGGETYLLDREIHKKIFDTYRENEGLVDLLLNTKKVSTSANTTYRWWEDGFLINSAIVESVVEATNTSATATVTIEEVSHQTPLGGTTGINSPFVVGDLVMLNGQKGRVMVKTPTPNAHVYAIEKLDGTNWTGIAITQRINKYGNAHADGTYGPASKARVPSVRYNYTQIFKNMYEAHGSESANRSEVEVKGKPYFYLKGIVDASKIHMLDMENTFIFGERGNTLLDTTAPDEDGKVYTTGGIDSTIVNYGINTGLATASTIIYSELEDIVKALTTERAPKQYVGLLSQDIFLAFDSALHTQNADTAINYSMFGSGNAKQSAVDFDYKSYTLGGYTMHNKHLENLDYEPVTGGTDFARTGYLMPMSYIRDAKDKMNMPTVTLMTKRNDKASRWMNEYTRGQKETGKDSTEYHLQCEGGLRLALANSCVKMV